MTVPSTVLNGFHGRPIDPTSGFFYFRNRWLDSETARFASADPMGFQDGPSSYIFSGNDPVNKSDPMGLACTTQHGGRNFFCNPMGEMELDSSGSGFYNAWAITKETLGNSLTDALFLNVFADAPHVILDDEASTGQKVWAGTKVGGAAFLNLGGAAVMAKAGTGRLATTRPARWAMRRLSKSRLGQRLAGVLFEDVGVLWRRARGLRGLRSAASETQGAVTNLGTRTIAGNSQILEKLSTGEGMSGVFDHSTGIFVLRHSTMDYPLPPGSVARYGGHEAVRGDLALAIGEDLSSATRGRLSGFSISKQADGSVRFGWNSGQINPGAHGVRGVPDALRPEIETAVRTALGI